MSDEKIPAHMQVLMAVGRYREERRLPDSRTVHVELPACHAYAFVDGMCRAYGFQIRYMYNLNDDEIAAILDDWQYFHHIDLTFTEHARSCQCLNHVEEDDQVHMEISHYGSHGLSYADITEYWLRRSGE